MTNGLIAEEQEFEPMLEALIKQHGLPLVKEHLSKLWPRARFDDWQRVYNIAERIARRNGRRHTV
jgi:hypothetical protein